MTLRVGVVGCGRIAQVMHLPYLDELPQYEVTAVADLSRQTVEAVARRYRVSTASQDYRDVVDADVDVVAVLSPNHVEVAQAAIDAGKHVFVEKPLAFLPSEAGRLVEATADAGVTLAVGYMKFYDPAYEELRRIASGLSVRLARIRVVFGRAQRPTRYYMLVEADDLPDSATTRSSFISETPRIAEMTGLDEERARRFVHMLNLGCHDLAVLRGVLGQPDEVLSVTAPSDVAVIATLAYPDGARAVVEIGEWPRLGVWDERLELVTDDEVLTLEFGNPWVRYAASRLSHARSTSEGTIVEQSLPAHYDQFREQWIHLHGVFADGAPPRATGADAVADVALALEIVRRLE